MSIATSLFIPFKLQNCSRRPVPGDTDWPPERPGWRGGLGGQAHLPHHKLPPETGSCPREARQGRPPSQNRSVARNIVLSSNKEIIFCILLFLGHCNEDQVQRLFRNFFTEATREEAEIFGRNVLLHKRDQTLSAAQIQSFLLVYKDDLAGAIRNSQEIFWHAETELD